jgi:glycosyltransferase involved in cell wall biosynthesis
MTSSSRHLIPNQPRWNYGIQKYKENRDVFCEKGLFSIVVLACGRPDITRQTILDTLGNTKLYGGDIEWIFIENGGCEANYEFFKSLPLERKVILRQENFGINQGLNQGWALSRGEYVMILENDWGTNAEHNFLATARGIFQEWPEVDMIQLRDPRDPNENHGLGKPLYNPITCDQEECWKVGVDIQRQKISTGHTFIIAGPYYSLNNNPIIIRKSLYREHGPYPEALVGCDPRHGETLLQEEVYQSKSMAAYIGVPLYRHIGRVQTKGV